ncbi:MAG TPA: TetR/AcrR family transcriptional regulator [Baekduia sp.]|uniref:TetR/AcrR family transcriptional regulator n=1 Tax=Baekduia sp. TaxID=2600305 RepID=UPI002D76D204|nr:TetR/AcrR family transcriptional regulator [Baekduia sp.]HET6509714.1 TetR/AcrR family transcriptional regulator [Baekduia sp.]
MTSTLSGPSGEPRDVGSSESPGRELPARARSQILTARARILEGFGDDLEPVNGLRTDTRRQVVIAAIDLFGRKGFEACTMRDLAAVADIKAPSLYNHFSSKERILAEAVLYAFGRFFHAVLGPLDDEPSGDWLEGIVRRHTLFQVEHPELARTNELILLDEQRIDNLAAEDADRISAMRSHYASILEALIRARTGWRSEKRLLVASGAVAAICDRFGGNVRPPASLSAEQTASYNWDLVDRMLPVRD